MEFPQIFGYAVLVAVIGWLWVSNAGLENDLLKQKIRYTDLTNQVEKQNAQIDAYKTVEKNRLLPQRRRSRRLASWRSGTPVRQPASSCQCRPTATSASRLSIY